HLDDETLNVASLSGMMAMDRTNLYRKMQSVFGLSPSVYIRNVRLEAACRLLKETDLPIVDVAMRTGFSSAKYFSSTFKEKYGILPSKFRAELEKSDCSI
ncbi:MAG: helix-turn-helix transcriptional regulator, partial [Muribaculaceae bacterium]|nr:helix-turn-helix transcriptional regulator [Muribaculaceae bacterium]